ncbi:MAG: DUF1847 domain-containing protein [Sphaerochaeta sp.]
MNLKETILNRIEQIRAFAIEVNYNTFEIAQCITFSREDSINNQYFEVYTVDCKYGYHTKKIFGDNSSRVLFNPTKQVQYLNDTNTTLNISISFLLGMI